MITVMDVAATAATQCFRLFDIIEVREKSDVSGTELALHLLIEAGTETPVWADRDKIQYQIVISNLNNHYQFE